MSTPTPSDFANRLTQRKQHEAEREEQIASLEKKLAMNSSEKHEKTVRNNRARFGAGKERASAASHSSRKGKAPAGSSTPRSPRKGGAKGTSSKSEPIVQSSEKTPSSMKQSTPPKKQDAATEPAKKQFVRKPHLTQRLSDNEALQELRASFPQPRHNNRSKNKFKKPNTGSSSNKK